MGDNLELEGLGCRDWGGVSYCDAVGEYWEAVGEYCKQWIGFLILGDGNLSLG